MPSWADGSERLSFLICFPAYFWLSVISLVVFDTWSRMVTRLRFWDSILVMREWSWR